MTFTFHSLSLKISYSHHAYLHSIAQRSCSIATVRTEPSRKTIAHFLSSVGEKIQYPRPSLESDRHHTYMWLSFSPLLVGHMPVMNGLLHGIIFIIIFHLLYDRYRGILLKRTYITSLASEAINEYENKQGSRSACPLGLTGGLKQNQIPRNHVNLDGRKITMMTRNLYRKRIFYWFAGSELQRDNERVTRFRRRDLICILPHDEKTWVSFSFWSHCRIILRPCRSASVQTRSNDCPSLYLGEIWYHPPWFLILLPPSCCGN